MDENKINFALGSRWNKHPVLYGTDEMYYILIEIPTLTGHVGRTCVIQEP
jgi:hypothetical protein